MDHIDQFFSDLQSRAFFVFEAVELQQGGCVRKADVEFWMPLEDTASITDPPVVAIPPMAVAFLELGNSALNSHEKVMHKDDTGSV